MGSPFDLDAFLSALAAGTSAQRASFANLVAHAPVVTFAYDDAASTLDNYRNWFRDSTERKGTPFTRDTESLEIICSINDASRRAEWTAMRTYHSALASEYGSAIGLAALNEPSLSHSSLSPTVIYIMQWVGIYRQAHPPAQRQQQQQQGQGNGKASRQRGRRNKGAGAATPVTPAAAAAAAAAGAAPAAAASAAPAAATAAAGPPATPPPGTSASQAAGISSPGRGRSSRSMGPPAQRTRSSSSGRPRARAGGQ
jgi:hypothetical protein